MSTIFESLRKLEEKENVKKLVVAKPLPEKNIAKAIPSFPANLFLYWSVLLTVLFVGFVFFVHLKYEKLNATLVSHKSAFDVQMDRLTKQMDEMSKKINSIDQNSQMMNTQLDHFSKELEKEREIQSRALEQQTKLIDQKMDQLSKQIKLEEEKQKAAVPPSSETHIQ